MSAKFTGKKVTILIFILQQASAGDTRATLPATVRTAPTAAQQMETTKSRLPTYLILWGGLSSRTIKVSDLKGLLCVLIAINTMIC